MCNKYNMNSSSGSVLKSWVLKVETQQTSSEIQKTLGHEEFPTAPAFTSVATLTIEKNPIILSSRGNHLRQKRQELVYEPNQIGIIQKLGYTYQISDARSTFKDE